MTFQQIWWQLVLLALGAYFFGNINTSVLISGLKKKDVRHMGSGNPGTMNMLRNFGAGLGALTLLLDILKGLIPGLIGWFVYRNTVIGGFSVGYLALFTAGFSVVLGHIFPVFLKFKGGKGVATTFGVFFAAAPIAMTIALVATIVFIVIFEYGGLADLLVIGSLSVYEALKLYELYAALSFSPAYLAVCCLIFGVCALTFSAHRKNIRDMLAGREHKTRLRGIIARIFKKKKHSVS